MNFKTYIDSPCGLRYIFENLKLLSPCSRRVLLECELMKNREQISSYYSKLDEVYFTFIANAQQYTLQQDNCGCCSDLLSATNGKSSLSKIEILLPMVREIWGTINRLSSDAVLDDIELFEIKSLAIVSEQIREVLSSCEITSVVLQELSEVIDILDPDKNRVLSFYIYDSYSNELREVRSRLKALNTLKECSDLRGGQSSELSSEQGSELSSRQMEELMTLGERMDAIEGEIRRELSGRLREFAAGLEQNLYALANLDILLAKAKQIKELGFSIPIISTCDKSSYVGLFNPQIKEILALKNREFTPIDIEFSATPVTLIGANMGGKTVVLKMVALAQLMFQYGFGIPAVCATINIKEGVMLSIGDEQNELAGLSSFGAEIKAIDAIVRAAKGGANILALIDEPARTTNPVEGTALVSGLLKVLSKCNLSLLLTTHYNIDGGDYKRLRVNGLVNGEMDYRLREVAKGEIPKEAISIAATLGVDSDWIDAAVNELNRVN